MMRRPARTARLLVPLFVVLAAGCAGSHTAKSSRLVITYGLGQPAKSAAGVRTACPPAADCAVRRMRGVVPSQWALVARYTLRCDPPGGTHPEPERACEALDTYVRGLRHATTCWCPAFLVPRGRARGELHGRPASIALDACTACGALAAERALLVLLPGLR